MKCEMTCETVPQWIEPFLDDQLDVPTAHAIVQHLTSCPTCTRKFETEDRFRGSITKGLIGGVQAPDGLWNRFLSRAFRSDSPISLAAFAEVAARYHRLLPEGLKIEGSKKSEVLAYYRSAAGYLPCDHHLEAMARAGARWEGASVAREVFPGRSLAWGTYRRSGDVVSHVSVLREEIGVLNAGSLKFPFYSFTHSGSTVSVTDCIRYICGFVTENEVATRHITEQVGAEFLQ